MLDYQAHPCYFAKFSFFAHVYAGICRAASEGIFLDMGLSDLCYI